MASRAYTFAKNDLNGRRIIVLRFASKKQGSESTL